MSSWRDRLYAAGPVWLQRLGIAAFGWFWASRRLGAVIERNWRAFAEREKWPADRMQDFVEAQLRTFVQSAYREVPFYREAFRAHDVTEELLEHSSFPLEPNGKFRVVINSLQRTVPGATFALTTGEDTSG